MAKKNKLEIALGVGDAEMGGGLSRFILCGKQWLITVCYNFAKNGNLGMLQELGEFATNCERL